ncbi:hypothetical protein LTR24_004847 [Lithohypha guttulata]|uniref:Uncharacterized protein n=1 Tax=Lithohypha guttulata TaxID=1690604 RepID=A0ABR0KAM6_9EURO|nr:hypothetical protein LTR24_004847 [Lithohypha guttulata]
MLTSTQSLAEAGQAVLGLFRAAVSDVDTDGAHEMSKDDIGSFMLELERFQIWAADVNLLLEDERSLGGRLDGSPLAKMTIQVLLQDLVQTLTSVVNMKSNNEVYMSVSQHNIDDPFGIVDSSAEVLAEAYEDAVMNEFCDQNSAPRQATNIPNVPRLLHKELDVDETVAHKHQPPTTRARVNTAPLKPAPSY